MIIKILKWLGIGLGVLTALLLCALPFYLDTPASQLEAKWATPPSKFLMVDGVRVHPAHE